jgi:hypothetical protein
MIAADAQLPDVQGLECTHCGVALAEAPRGESPIRYFCCPRCGRWQSSLYARDVVRRHAGVRVAQAPARPEPSFEQVKVRLDAWMARLERDDPHAVLGVAPGSSPDAVRERYRELALANHPDRGGDGADMRRINDAYERIRARRR